MTQAKTYSPEYTEQDLARLRQFVRALMRDAELPQREVTVMHRNVFQRAGVEWKDGQKMDECLSQLTMRQLRGLVDQLRDEEDDDE